MKRLRRLSRSEAKTRVQKELVPLRTRIDEMVAEGQAQAAIDTLFAALTESLTEQTQKVSGGMSERVSEDQLTLLLDEVPGDERAPGPDALSPQDLTPDAPAAESTDERRKARPHGRRKLPEALPREVVVLAVPEDERECPSCHEPRVVIGHETSEVLELVPAHFKVIQYQREKVACSLCREGICTAAPANRLVERCLAGTGLLAHVAVAKYADHVPLNRLCGLYRRLGVELATSTLCGWIELVADAFKPIVDLMWEEGKTAWLKQTDATGIKVLDHDEPSGKRLGTMWGYLFAQLDFVLRYTPTAEGATGPWLHLAGCGGYVLADAANIFDRLYNGKVGTAVEVGCNAHARRRFFKLLDSEPSAAVAIDFYRKLYDIERQAKADGLDADALLKVRQVRSAPLFAGLKSWLIRMKDKRPPKSAFAGAVRYALNHWAALTRCLEDGRLPLDNNLMELQLRSLVVGRKNWLFAGSHEGAERAAILISITRSCALNGIDPMAYVKDVLDTLSGSWPQKRLAELTPRRWAQARKTQPQPQTDAP